MNEDKFNWECFKRSIIISADMETLYKYIATSNRISKWFIGEAIYTSLDVKIRAGDEFAKKGDKYDWKWYHKDLEVNGTILEANDIDYFKFTFGGAGTVSFSLKQLNSRTLVELYQEIYPDSTYDKFAHINCYVCWTFFLINLKSVAEHGIDLRETEFESEELVNR